MVSPQELREISVLLDEALALPAAQRNGWIDALPGEAARLAPALRSLLQHAGHAETADFIDRGPAFTAPGDLPKSSFGTGDQVGPYRLEREIGRGGMGEVWLAERADGQLKRSVALKLPMLGVRRSILVQRFARERDILGGLAHPHIARLYDAGLSDDGQPYLALEYVQGRPITTYCAEHGLTLAQRVDLLRQVMDAVQFAHANLVIHRDLKPSNVLVTDEGQAMLLDFGIAKLLADADGQASETELTQLGGRALTLDYAAPEQVSGAPISTATDVWALGVLAYELLTGERPFQGLRREVEQGILEHEPRRPGALPADLASIVLKALKKAPVDRYVTVNAFSEDLERWLRGEPVQAQPDSRWYRMRRFVGRNRAGVATAAGVLALVLVFSAVSLRQAQIAREQTRLAQTEAKTAQAVQNFLEGIFQASNGNQPDPIQARQRTAKQLLDEGAARIQTELDDAPAAKLRVLATLSDLFDQMGDLDATLRLAAERVRVAQRYFGNDSPDLAFALVAHSKIMVDALQLDEGLELLTRAEAIAARLTPVSDDLRIALDGEFANYHRFRNEASGLPYSQREVTLLRKRGPSLELVSALANLGAMQQIAGDLEAARAAFKEALGVASQVPGGAGSRVGGVYDELSALEARRGDQVAAEAALRKVIEIDESSSGSGGIRTITSKLRLGGFLVTDGRAREALAVLQPLREQVQSQAPSAERDRSLPILLMYEARAEAALGHLLPALALLMPAAGIVESQVTEPRTAVSRAITRMSILTSLGRYGEAEDVARAARDMIAKSRLEGGDMDSRLNRQRVFLELAQRKQATTREALAVVLTADTAGTSGMPPSWSNAMRAEVAAEFDTPESAAAEIRGWLQALSNTHVDIGQADQEARMNLALGRVLLKMGRAGDALTPLRANLAHVAVRSDPAASPAVLEAKVALALALVANDQRDAALELAGEANEIRSANPELGPHLVEPLRRVKAALP